MPQAVELDTDADILEGCRRGDAEAQRQVFERYRDRVHSIALHYLKGDATLALDVTQEVFVKVFRGIRTFRQNARFSTWLYRIVANACKDELRRRRRLVFFGDLPDPIHPTASPHAATDLRADVADAVQQLTPPLRMAVLLRYFEDLSYEEIAGALDCTPGTVASRLHRAHAILAGKLAQHGPGQAGSEESES
jgi:RNA polymerase sigma-70 factor (ECF subfamily)